MQQNSSLRLTAQTHASCNPFRPPNPGWQVKCALDKTYVPDFKQAFQHFLIHTGGRAVIEEVEKRLELTPQQSRASKDTLHRFGNTCCAAVFYVLTNVEAKVIFMA